MICFSLWSARTGSNAFRKLRVLIEEYFLPCNLLKFKLLNAIGIFSITNDLNSMKVLQVNVSYGYGSTGTIVRDLYLQCAQNQIECKVACLYYTEQNSDIYCMSAPLSNKLHALFSRIEGKQGYYSKRATLKLLRFIKVYNPDIVHLHNLHSNYINLPILLSYLSEIDVKVVVTHHDCWLYTGGCSHYTHSHCFKWKESCGNCPQRYEEFAAIIRDSSSQILRDKVRLFSAVKKLTSVGVSNWITNEARVGAFAHAYSITIHSGIDTSFFRPVDSSLRNALNIDDKFIILAPTNKWFLPSNRNILDYFLTHLTDDMILLFFGPGDFQAPSFTNQVLNIGFISSREQLRELYCAGDVMVNCSKEDTLSLLNLEVQSCGTPVVTYSNTGIKETINEQCGFVVENDNPEAAWNAMMSIKEKGRSFYIDACHQWVDAEFEKNKNYQKYINLYKSL